MRRIKEGETKMSEATDVTVGDQPGKAKQRQFDAMTLLERFGALFFLLVLCAVFAILEPAFLKPLNLFNVLRQVSVFGLLAIGMTFVILTAGIDLSIGSLLALAGLVAAAVEKGGTGLLTGAGAGEAAGYGLGAAVLAALAVGVFGGTVQGLAITRLRVPPFVVTLGGMSVWRGVALVFSGGQPISAFREEFRFWGQGFIGPVPVPVVIFLLFALIAHIVLRYSQYGRYIYAVGGNLEAARLSGLNTKRLIASVYVIMGLFCGLAGFILAARLNSAEQVAGVGYELNVIAGVVIGGTSLFGGEGGIPGTIIGILLIGVLSNGLTLLNVSAYYQQIIIGIIIVLAVFFDQFIKRRRRS
jgi:ribose/xylose/arabinose/galactoside ABC-type transport system permease subunit